MRARIARSAILSALLVPATASASPIASPVASQAAADQAVSANARDLVALFTDKDVLAVKLQADLDRGYHADPQMQALEVDYPGITDYVVARVLPPARRRMFDRAPGMWDAMASYFTANLDDGTLAKVLAFYRSPTGARVIAIIRTLNTAPLSSAVVAGRGSMTGKALENGTSASIQASGGIAPKLSPADLQEATRFLGSEAGRKWTAAQPGFYTAVSGVMNNALAQELPLQIAERDAAISDFKHDHPKKA